MGRQRLFLIWAAVLTVLWVFANWPQESTFKFKLHWAGFPWTFAFWENGQLRWFSPGVLAADVAVGVGVIVAVAWLCAWSRDCASRPITPADGVAAAGEERRS